MMTIINRRPVHSMLASDGIRFNTRDIYEAFHLPQDGISGAETFTANEVLGLSLNALESDESEAIDVWLREAIDVHDARRFYPPDTTGVGHLIDYWERVALLLTGKTPELLITEAQARGFDVQSWQEALRCLDFPKACAVSLHVDLTAKKGLSFETASQTALESVSFYRELVNESPPSVELVNGENTTASECRKRLRDLYRKALEDKSPQLVRLLTFEDKKVHLLEYKGRRCYLALELARAANLKDPASAIRAFLKKNTYLTEGQDYIVVKGQDLNDLKNALGKTPIASRTASQVTLFFEGAMRPVIGLRRGKAGLAFMEWIIRDVLPSMGQTELDDRNDWEEKIKRRAWKIDAQFQDKNDIERRAFLVEWLDYSIWCTYDDNGVVWIPTLHVEFPLFGYRVVHPPDVTCDRALFESAKGVLEDGIPNGLEYATRLLLLLRAIAETSLVGSSVSDAEMQALENRISTIIASH